MATTDSKQRGNQMIKNIESKNNKKIKTQNVVQESFTSPSKKLTESNLSLNSTTKRVAGKPKIQAP
jgi:hypothetical protein